MTNVSLLPGAQTLDEVFDGDGIYMETNRSWSIDDKRYNFQFGCEIGWEMRGGKRARMLKNPSYSGISTEFWNSCAAIAGPEHWTLWGMPNCGKGQPEQVMGTGHGASPARFRNVQKSGARMPGESWPNRAAAHARVRNHLRHGGGRRPRRSASATWKRSSAPAPARSRASPTTPSTRTSPSATTYVSVRVLLERPHGARHHQPHGRRLACARGRGGRRAHAPPAARPRTAAACRTAAQSPPCRAGSRPPRAPRRPTAPRAVAEAIAVVEEAGQTAAGIYSTGESVLCASTTPAAWPPSTPRPWRSSPSPPWRADSSGWAKASACCHGDLDPRALAQQRRSKGRPLRAPRACSSPAATP